MSESNIKRRGRLSYIEPNNIVIGKTLVRSDNIVKNPLEDYNILIDLYVEMVDRFRCGVENTSSGTGEINGVEGKKYVHFFGGTNGNLSTNYTNISLHDTIHGDQREMIGIESISINYDSWFMPQVDITFTDLRGASVMIPQEAGMVDRLREERAQYEHDLEEAKKSGKNLVTRDPRDLTSLGTDEFSGSFFKSLFAFPPPVFYLSVKGFYGNPVSYKLALQNVTLELDSSSGNFKIQCKFIGYLFGLFADLPAVYCAVAPYMKYNNNGDGSEKSNWANEDFRFPATEGNPEGSPMIMFSDFNETISKIQDGGLSDFYKSEVVQQLAELETVNSTLDNLITMFPCSASKGFKCVTGNSCYIYYRIAVGEEENKKVSDSIKASMEKYGKIIESLQLLKENREDLNIGKKFYDSVKDESGSVITSPRYSLKIVGDTETASGSAKLSDSPEFKAKKTCLTDNKGTIYLYEYYSTIDVLLELKKAKETFLTTLMSKEKEVANARNENIRQKYGFIPCIQHMFHMVFCHMNMFMDIFFNCLSDINNQLINKQRTFSNFGLSPRNVDYNTENESDETIAEQQIPPFPLVFKDIYEGGSSRHVEVWPPEYDERLEALPEVQFTYALINASREFNSSIERTKAKSKANTTTSTSETNTDGSGAGSSSNESQVSSTKKIIIPGTFDKRSFEHIPLTHADLSVGYEGNPYEFLFDDKDYLDNKDRFIEGLVTTCLSRFSFYYNRSSNTPTSDMATIAGIVEAQNILDAGNDDLKAIKNYIIGDNKLSSNKNKIVSYTETASFPYLNKRKFFKDGKYNWLEFYPIKSYDEKNISKYVTDNNAGIYTNEDLYVPVSTDYIKSDGDSPRDYYVYLMYSSKLGDLFNFLDYKFNIKDNNDKQVKVSDLFYKDDVYDENNLSDSKSIYSTDILASGNVKDLSIKSILSSDNTEKYTTKNYRLSNSFSRCTHINGTGVTRCSIFQTNLYYMQDTVYAKAYLFLMSLATVPCNSSLYNSSSITMCNGYRMYIDILTEGAFFWRYKSMEASSTEPIKGYTDGKCPEPTQYYKESVKESGYNYGAIIDSKSKNFYDVSLEKLKLSLGQSERADKCVKLFKAFAESPLFNSICENFELNEVIGTKTVKFTANTFEKNSVVISDNNGVYEKVDTAYNIYKDGSFKSFDKFLNFGENSSEAENIILRILTTNCFCVDLSYNMNYTSGHDSDLSLTDAVNKMFSTLYEKLSSSVANINGDGSESNKDTVGGNNSEGKTSSEASSTQKVISQKDGTKSKDIRLATYLVLKNLYDKWICGSKREDWSIKSDENVYSKFVYMDNFYTEIGERLMVNLAKMKTAIEKICVNSNGEHISNRSVYELLTNIANDNKCVIYPLNQMFGVDNNDGYSATFDVKSYRDSEFMLHEKTSFVVLYSHQASNHLAEEDNGLNDGFDLADSLGETEDINPVESMLTEVEGVKIKYIPAFGVTYGKQNQSYFKDIKLTTASPSVSDYTIQSMMNIASKGGEGQSQSNSYGQDLYRTFANYCYKVDITMLGDMMITPLMYFQLNNIPLWHGAYIVTSVNHTISPGMAETSFSGYRVSKYAHEFVDPCIIELENTIKTKYSTTKLGYAGSTSNESTRTYQMTGGFTYGMFSGFTYEMFESSSKAKSLNIDNSIPENIKPHIAELVETLLAPMKGCCGNFKISSGYRCKELNDTLSHASKTSVHMIGYAADIVPDGQTYEEFTTKIKKFLKSGAPYDQYIEEEVNGRKWVHIGVRSNNGSQRKSNLKYNGSKYIPFSL